MLSKRISCSTEKAQALAEITATANQAKALAEASKKSDKSHHVGSQDTHSGSPSPSNDDVSVQEVQPPTMSSKSAGKCAQVESDVEDMMDTILERPTPRKSHAGAKQSKNKPNVRQVMQSEKTDESSDVELHEYLKNSH